MVWDMARTGGPGTIADCQHVDNPKIMFSRNFTIPGELVRIDDSLAHGELLKSDFPIMGLIAGAPKAGCPRLQVF
jgi:hypothetical protein